MDNLCGPITVEAHSGREVVLEAKKIVYARDEARARKAEEEVTLDIGEKGNVVDGSTSTGPSGKTGGKTASRGAAHAAIRATWSITASGSRSRPASNMVLSTVLDGDIEVRGVEGASTSATSPAGSVSSTRPARGDARAVNGGVTVVFRATRRACRFKTVSGDVEVGFPAAPSADFRIKTMHGQAYSDFDVTALPKAPPVREERREKGGKYVYRSEGRFRRPRRPGRPGDPARNIDRRHPDRQALETDILKGDGGEHEHREIANIVVLALLVAGTWGGVIAQTKEEPPDRAVVPLTDPSKPAKIEVSIMRGSITVKGYQGREIIVEARVREKALSELFHRGIRRTGLLPDGPWRPRPRPRP